MNIKFFFQKEQPKDKRKSIKVEKVNDTIAIFIKEAERTALIVDERVAGGQYSEMSVELNDVTNNGISREQYVFEGPEIKPMIIRGVVCAALILLFIPYLLTGIKIISLSAEFSEVGRTYIDGVMGVLVINGIAVYKTITDILFLLRYNKYHKNLRFHDIEMIDDLDNYVNENSSLVIKDLKKAIKWKLIPQGHFGTDDIVFMVSDEIYSKYQEHQAVYDRYYRKLLEERARMCERSHKIQKILDKGQKYIDSIHDSNDIIKDKVISQKLDRMEEVVKMIFYEVDINPEQSDDLGLFLNYYLPTTQKLLDAYIDIDEKKVVGKSAEKAKKEIEGSLDIIIASFEGILDKFYQEQEMDIANEISAMEIVMKQEEQA